MTHFNIWIKVKKIRNLVKINSLITRTIDSILIKTDIKNCHYIRRQISYDLVIDFWLFQNWGWGGLEIFARKGGYRKMGGLPRNGVSPYCIEIFFGDSIMEFSEMGEGATQNGGWGSGEGVFLKSRVLSVYELWLFTILQTMMTRVRVKYPTNIYQKNIWMKSKYNRMSSVNTTNTIRR